MFNFTTQSVYNNIVKATPQQIKNKTVKNPNLIIENTEGKTPYLRIGNTRFNKNDILDVVVKTPTVENLANVRFNMQKILIPNDSTDNEITARIVLYVGLSMNDQSAFYANNFVYKGKPLYIEFNVKKTDTAENIAKKVKANADKYFLLTLGSEKILDVTLNGPEVVFTGVNGYQQIKTAKLQKFDPNRKVVDCCTNQGEYYDVITGVPVIYSTDINGVVSANTKKLCPDGTVDDISDDEVAIAPGIEAFGDYNWIMHNLRLPTAANYYPWSPANRMGEMPIPGQSYTQIIVRMLKERDGIMGEIVGARGTSVTTHVFYVAGNIIDNTSSAKLVLDEFSKLLGQTASSKLKVNQKLQNPYSSVYTTPTIPTDPTNP